MGALDPFAFGQKHAKAHLVFGEYDNTQAPLKNPTRVRVISRLIKRLGLKGDWSGIDLRDEGRYELHLSDEDDAERVGEALQAKKNGKFPGWASQRGFQYDAKTWAKIQQVLA